MNAIDLYRSRKKTVFARARLGYERFREFFRLPRYYRAARAVKDCDRSRLGIASDLLTWYFSYKTLPVHYSRCRIWEVPRTEWGYYFGSNYRPGHEARLRKVVWPVEYRILFDDKYVCALLCQALGIRIPRTYGVLDPALDFRSRLAEWLAGAPAEGLIVKPLCGRSGRDIILAEKTRDGMVVRTKSSVTPLERLALREKMVVQEIVTQHPALAAFSPSSVNTLRMVTMLTKDDQVILVNAAMRTGVGPSFVDNWSAGGVAAGIDRESGRLQAIAYDKKATRYVAHPTSGRAFAGFAIPGWERIRAEAFAIQRLFPFYRMMGLDLAIGPDGEPILIEINYAPEFTFLEQTGGPVLRSEPVLRAFGEYDLLVNKHQRRLYAELGGPRPPLNGGLPS